MAKAKPVATYARMWPRELFDCTRGKKLIVKELDILSKPGVYVLYHDKIPHYVGRATRLRKRLWSHAKNAASRYYDFWNYFTVFVIEDETLRKQLEGMLIAAMPTANGAKPRIPKARLPLDVRKYLHALKHPQENINKPKAKAAGSIG